MIDVIRWSRLYAGRPESVGEARRFALTFVAGLVAGQLAEAVELVVSELCTNAIEHTASGDAGGWFVVELEMSPGLVRVIVIDKGAPYGPEPVTGMAPTWALSGRGLHIVDAVSKQWGAESILVGRRVWADIDGALV